MPQHTCNYPIGIVSRCKRSATRSIATRHGAALGERWVALARDESHPWWCIDHAKAACRRINAIEQENGHHVSVNKFSQLLKEWTRKYSNSPKIIR